MRCLGRTRNLARCKKSARLICCYQHRHQPYALLLSALTLVGLLAGLFQDLVRPLFLPEKGNTLGKPGGALALVDVRFLEKKQNEFPVLDVKLRNTAEITFLKRARFMIKGVWPYRWIYCPTALEASWKYDVVLPISGTPFEHEIVLSQVVPQGGADRFQFALGNDAPVVDESLSYVFWVELEIIYNEDDSAIRLPDLAFVSGPAQSLDAFTQCRHPMDLYAGNKKVYDGLRGFSGITDEDVPNILKKYDGSRVAKFEAWIGEAGDDKKRLYYYIWCLAILTESEPSARDTLDRLGQDEREVVRDLASKVLYTLDNQGVLDRPEAAGNPWRS